MTYVDSATQGEAIEDLKDALASDFDRICGLRAALARVAALCDEGAGYLSTGRVRAAMEGAE